MLTHLRRELRKAAFLVLPRSRSHAMIRKTLNLRIPREDSQLRFSLVCDLFALKQALSLVQKNYEREGYASKSLSGVRLTPYHLLPDTIVIAAMDGEQIVATISVITRNEFGLPIEGAFAIADWIGNRGRIVEISSLAVNSEYSGEFGKVLYNLMKYMYHCNVDLLQADFEVIGVNPKMVPLYEAILLFQRVPETSSKSYDFANGAPVIPMYFDLRQAIETYSKVYNGQPPHKNMMDFFLLNSPSHFVFPTGSDWRKKLPQNNPSSLREMLSWTELSLTAWQKSQLIKSHSDNPECQIVLREFLSE